MVIHKTHHANRIARARACPTCQAPARPGPALRPIALRPGDVVLLQTHDRFHPSVIERFQQSWRERFGDRFPVAILQGDWKIDILRPAKERA